MSIDPPGDRRADVHAAMIAATVANAFRGKNTRPARISDFLRIFDITPRAPKSPQHLKMIREAFLASYPGEVIRK